MVWRLRVRDRTTGLVTLDITDSVTRHLGTITVPNNVQSGSVTHPGFADGIAWYYLQLNIPAVQLPPNVEIVGNTLTWSHAEPIGNGRAPSGKILFGIR